MRAVMGTRRRSAIREVLAMKAYLDLHDDVRFKALGIMLDAWEEGSDAGVSTEYMAYAALFTALTELVTEYGEDEVAHMTSALCDRIRQGEFTLYGAKQ
ncbi:MAG: hypothetical protein RLZ98_510 [Pseudomonadota bacterium]|jgi:transcription initiation factor TFIIIB Brf1 subunit/transcription initiation factor TFIIB